MTEPSNAMAIQAHPCRLVEAMPPKNAPSESIQKSVVVTDDELRVELAS